MPFLNYPKLCDTLLGKSVRRSASSGAGPPHAASSPITELFAQNAWDRPDLNHVETVRSLRSRLRLVYFKSPFCSFSPLTEMFAAKSGTARI